VLDDDALLDEGGDRMATLTGCALEDLADLLGGRGHPLLNQELREGYLGEVHRSWQTSSGETTSGSHRIRTCDLRRRRPTLYASELGTRRSGPCSPPHPVAQGGAAGR